MQEIANSFQKAIKELFNQDVEIELTRTDEQFGDLATNVALRLGKQLGQNPREVAQKIVENIKSDLIEKSEVAGSGFINVTLSDDVLWSLAEAEPNQLLSGKTYVVEYSCPNAFKDLHTGHLYNTIAGDVLARLIERSGATVHRTSFGGDVGLHVARCLWGIINKLGGESLEKLNQVSDDPLERASWISECYVLGAKAYEEDEAAKERIIQLNKTVYKIQANQDKESALAQIYWVCRQWSFDYFKAFYQLIQVDQMRYYPESETAELGLGQVREQLKKGNLEESDGAVVFRGDEAKNLHTRVFVTSKGLPTYETKDVGVILAEQAEYAFDHRVLLTGNDQAEYMRVVFAAMDVFQPGIAKKMTHLTNGTVRFGDGKKMSSRLGNVSRAVDVVAAVREKVSEVAGDNVELQNHITLGAIKYEFAKYRLGGDVAFDIEESVSLRGNSGPYLQYAHARARSILHKATTLQELSLQQGEFLQEALGAQLESAERTLLRKLSEYNEVVERATHELMPHYICTYLYELAQTFNRFYENNRVIGDDREQVRLSLVQLYAKSLKNGLELLGIHAPEQM